MTYAQESTSSASIALERWRRSYATRLFITDLVVVLVAVFGAQFARFGIDDPHLAVTGFFRTDLTIAYTALSTALVVAWMLSLEAFATRDHKVIGSGTTEYRRIADATIRIFALLAIVAFIVQSEVGRGYLLIALPFGLALLLVSRWSWRQWLKRQRAIGRYVQRTVLVGQRTKIEHIATQMAREPNTGIELVGAVTERGDRGDLEAGIPVLAGFDRVLEVLDQTSADTVIFNADSISPHRIRQFGWDLEARGISLIVAPALTDIAGPRIHASPVAGLPLIHVDFPEFEGRKYVAKRAFDIVGSSALLVILSPLFLVLAVLVQRDSPGPVFFRQERVGLNGSTFKMLKFRSMGIDAERQPKGLLDVSDGNGMLFKMRSDPRVTKVGAILRKYSLDELPQLINVLRGEMSLVGPRPPLEKEVANYDDWVHRRLLVKPGMTGLWQVGGRSDLSWEDSVRLDLYYVENWSVTGDLIILWKTGRAVIAPNGAY